jgi:hypothetical protein
MPPAAYHDHPLVLRVLQLPHLLGVGQLLTGSCLHASQQGRCQPHACMHTSVQHDFLLMIKLMWQHAICAMRPAAATIHELPMRLADLSDKIQA